MIIAEEEKDTTQEVGVQTGLNITHYE
jgi:arginine kinase